MTGFFGSRIGSGQLGDDLSGHQLAWIGGQRLLDWDPERSRYRLWSVELDAETGPTLAAQGRGRILAGHEGDSLVWLGGDRLLAVKSGGAARNILRIKEGRSAFAVTLQPIPPRWLSAWVGSEPIYLGRGRVLARNARGGGVHVVLVSEKAIEPLHAPWQGQTRAAGNVPKDLTLTWMGADRVIGWRNGGEAIALYRHGPLGAALTAHPTPSSWTLPTGPLTQAPFGAGLGDLAPQPVSGTKPLVCYVGRDTALLLWTGTGKYELWKLDFNGSIHPEIEDYLELHPEVGDAMSWELHSETRSYLDWDLHPWTERFHATLSRFYDEASWGGPISIAFLQELDPDLGPGRHRVGPAPAPEAPPNDQYIFTFRDMAEIWLAHLSQYLWTEISRQVSWHLHEPGSKVLETNLPGTKMMERVPNTQRDRPPLYWPNQTEAGGGLATDPSPVFAFALEKNLVRSNPTETVDAICRWAQSGLIHYATEGERDPLASWDWKFNVPPLATMIERRLDPLRDDPVPRYRAWRGCHGSSSLMTFLARVLNVPARGTEGYIPFSHHAIDFPQERLFCPHADDFYATQELNDPVVTPATVFGAKESYDNERELWTTPPEDPDAAVFAYPRWLYIRAQGIPTFWLIEAHWQDVIYDTNDPPTTGYLASALRNNGLSDQEIIDAAKNLGPRIQTIIDDFMQQPEHPPGMTLEEGLAAYRAPILAWKAAKGLN